MYVVIDQSSPLSISIFLSLCLLFYPPYTRISNQLAYIQVCMVCMYACVHIGVYCWQDGVSLRGSDTDQKPFRMRQLDGNPSYGCVTCYITSQLRPGKPLTGLLSVGVHTCMDLRMYVHGCIYMRVWGWDWVSCMDYEGLQR